MRVSRFRSVWALACVLLVASIAMSGWSRVQAQEQPPELAAIYKHGLQLYQAGRYAEAIPVAKEYIAVATAKYGEQHLFFAKGLGYLGDIYQSLNRLDDAEPLFKR